MKATIKKGSSGDLVKVSKYLMGYSERGKAGNMFDAAFATFVQNWQRKYKLDADGIIGAKTWAKLAELAPTCSTKKNKTSAATCALQILLGGLAADGIFGAKTKAGVVAFQAASGLTADGVCGPKTWRALIVGAEKVAVTTPVSSGKGTITPVPGKFQQPVNYKQYDSRWGRIMYSNHNDKKQTIKSSGCGPTAMADIVASLIDKSVTPPVLATLSTKNGHRTYNGGTAWAFFKDIAEEYGFNKFVQTSSFVTMQNCLKTGGYVVVSFGPSKWTKGGHFCTLWKDDGKYIYVNDPASSSSSRAKGTYSEVKKAAKQYFCFWI